MGRDKWWWHIPGKVDEIADALEIGLPVIVSSELLWSALSTAGLPNDDYGRDAALDGKYFLVDEFDVFDEWTQRLASAVAVKKRPRHPSR